MFKFARVLALTFSISACASAGVITWSAAGLSDNNGGAFLTSASLVTNGLNATFLLPDFSQSDFAPFSGEVDLAITATSVQPWINGVVVTIFGFTVTITHHGSTTIITGTGPSNARAGSVLLP